MVITRIGVLCFVSVTEGTAMGSKEKWMTLVGLWGCCLLTMAANPGDPLVELTYSITEELPRLTLIGNLVVDGDLAEVYGDDVDALQFSIQSSRVKDYFTINNSGILKTDKVIDRDFVCPQAATCDMELNIGLLSPDRREYEALKVIVHVLDINDNAPEFGQDRMELTISESAAVGTSVVLPTAYDPDSGIRSVQTYELIGGGDVFRLKVSNNSDSSVVEVRLVLHKELDREEKEYYSLRLVARDGGSSPLPGTLTLSVTVQDANDNNPKFANQTYNVVVVEDAPIGKSLLKVLATDPDEGLNGEILYKWEAQTGRLYGSMFAVHNVSGVVSLKGQLDYEAVKVYHLLVTAYDKGASGVPTQAKIIVEVKDINDHKPVITVNAFASTTIEVPENSDAGGFVAHVSVEDEDSGINGQVICLLGQGPFSLDLLYGNVFTISTTAVLDREVQDQYVIQLSCQDKGTPSLTSTQNVIVTISDQNDHAPEFTQKLYSVTISENRTVNIPIVQVKANDADAGDNGRVTYRLQGLYANLLSIESSTGLITTAAVIDYEQIKQLEVTVIASDMAALPLSSNASVVVTVVDSNDEYPLFQQAQYDFVTFENKTAGTDIGSVVATDADSEPYNQIKYTIIGNSEILHTFIINEYTGRISITKSLDREYKALFEFQAVATNVGYPEMRRSVPVIVHIADINDNAPTLVFPTPHNNTIQVSSLARRGYYFARVEARDADIGPNAKLTYNFARAAPGDLFDIDSFTGALSLKADFPDHEIELYSLLITVRDGGSPPKSAVAELNVVVNKSLASPYPGHDSSPLPTGTTSAGLSQSQTILISLAMVTLLLVTILIVAIVLVKRRQTKDSDDMLPNGICDDLSSSNESNRTKETTSTNNDLNSSSQTSSDSYDSKARKEVKFDINTNSINLQFQKQEDVRHYDYPSSTLVTMQVNIFYYFIIC